MVKRPTVLVLGAGASQGYGFPSGRGLIQEVTTALGRKESATSPVNQMSQWLGIDAKHLRKFRKELMRARRGSIDAFIEARSKDYDRVGRGAIAYCMLRHERDELLFPEDSELDWYSTLFDAILGNSPESFKQNLLKVITFNFDRSFERALYLALEANFPESDLDALSDVVPVLHVHGDLGIPTWQKRHVFGAGMRDYTFASDSQSLLACTERIRIVHHAITEGMAQQIREALAWAERICFIGFSYHELNLQKLNAPASLESKEVRGTRFRMGAGPQARVRKLLGDRLTFIDAAWTAHDVVRQLDWFYD